MNFDTTKTMLLSFFIDDFKTWFTALDSEQEQPALQVVAQLYRGWLYSPLIKNTAVTPANIMYYSSGNCVIVSAEKSKTLSFKTTYLSYNQNEDKHFILKDLSAVAEFMKRGIKRNTNGTFDNENVPNLVQNLHIRCKYYANYLMEIVIKSGKVVKLPSIYTEAYVVEEGEPDLTLKDIVMLSCEIVADKLNSALAYGMFSGEDIYYYLTSFNSTDLMLENMFATSKLSPLSMLGKPISMMTRGEKSVLALFYRLISILGEWFFTVFGLYLGIIQPMYKSEFSFSKYDYAIYSGDDDALRRIIFQCPSHFYLNNNGASILSVKANDPYTDSFSQTDMLYILKQITDKRNKI
jgi:hypothetical protein